MNQINKEGSGILLVVMVMTALLLICLANWRSTTYIFDVVLQRGVCEKKNKLTHGLLNYGIAYSQEQFDFLMSSTLNAGVKTISLDNWPTAPSVYGARLSVKKIDRKNIKVDAELLEKGKGVDHMSCTLHRQAGEKVQFVVSEFYHA